MSILYASHFYDKCFKINTSTYCSIRIGDLNLSDEKILYDDIRKRASFALSPVRISISSARLEDEYVVSIFSRL